MNKIDWIPIILITNVAIAVFAFIVFIAFSFFFIPLGRLIDSSNKQYALRESYLSRSVVIGSDTLKIVNRRNSKFFLSNGLEVGEDVIEENLIDEQE